MAFLVMDLSSRSPGRPKSDLAPPGGGSDGLSEPGAQRIHRGLEPLAWRALNRYLEHTGDYEGLDLLPYYLVYRALVRAKVEAIRAHQEQDDYTVCHTYLNLAERLAQPRAAQLILTLGVSGSGKTWLSQQVLEALGTIRLRADVERKRLFGLKPLESSRPIPGGIYTSSAGARTLARLTELARPLLMAGWPVILDATFLAPSWRGAAIAVAEELHLPWRILRLPANPETLRERLARRENDASEADAAVMEAQLNAPIHLNADELAHTLDGSLPLPELLKALNHEQ
jgi:predicted kinase